MIALGAQTSIPTPAQAAEVCAEPRAPRIPRGASVQQREMEDAERDVSNYMHQTRLYVNCLQRAIRQAEQDAAKLSSEFNRQVDIYNSRSPQ
jgi:hypothetical protein